MAKQTIKLGEEITVGTTPQEYVVDETNVTLAKPNHDFVFTTDASNSGTIKFGIGASPGSGQKAWAADKSSVLTAVQNGVKNIWAVGSGAGQKFTIT